MTPPEATPAEIFIAEHRLEFSDSGEAGPTWTGLSACDGEPFELLFQADKNGPTALQITRYYSFLENFAAIRERIQTAFKSHCVSLGAEIARKFQDKRAEIDIVTVLAEGEDGEIEMCCRASRGWTIFSKHILFAVDLRANKIVKLTGA